MVLMIDNYDSFTYNLVQYLCELGVEVVTWRNDAFKLDDITRLKPGHIIISPGPRTPAEAGLSTAVVKTFSPHIPILGVCLGHQCIGHVFGGDIIRARVCMHGKTSSISHDGTGVFANLPTPLTVTRYHSLVLNHAHLPACLNITAMVDGEIMGIAHQDYPLHGVQFHPEAILSEHGHELLKNFLNLGYTYPIERHILG